MTTQISSGESSRGDYYLAVSAKFYNYVRAIDSTEAREVFAASLYRAKQPGEITNIQVRPALPSETRNFNLPSVVLGPTSVYATPRKRDATIIVSESMDSEQSAANQKLLASLKRAEAVQNEVCERVDL